MLQSHYDVIYMRCCDFSMDLEEIAKFEHLAAHFHLRQSQRSLQRHLGITDGLPSLYHLHFAA